MSKNDKILLSLLDKHELSSDEKEYLLNVIKNIYNHNEFLHYDKMTLGEHILEVTIIMYILSKKRNLKNYDIESALNIAMLHDLYTLLWQNNPKADVQHFINKYGF